uniref:Ubiquitin-like protease family profile domain-containing protein n=1 Tax=Gouania willdenowi TaxID=441366 RepID=A0A8C5GBC4_GOUWI
MRKLNFIPLHRDDVLTHVKRTFNNADLSDRYVDICQSEIAQKATPPFCVRYRKHALRLDDLLTLADQHWLNDQVINMYGELIVDSSNHKVHFLNSFFHRQLMTKGYEGVKRWTKKVDLFSKDLLLVPVHLQVHWCLVTVDMSLKKISLYDSRGIAFHENILRYLMTEAKEKHQISFKDGWMNVPQQKNSNDCGVFILEYSRCFGLNKPLHFTQNDVPKIRKRIYRELCECKVHV